MKWITLLVFTYWIQGEEVEAIVAFEDEQQCESAIRAADPLYNEIRKVSLDSSVRCERTAIPSSYTMRPKARTD